MRITVSRTLRGLLCAPGLVLGLALGVAAAAAPALAQTNDQVFTVRGIDVDVSADSVTAARDQALAQGQARAMRALLERLVVPEDQGQIPSLSAAEVQDYVLDFGVSDERTSAVRYIATMTVRFRPGAVRRLLRSNGLRFAEVQAKPVLVLPVWGSEGRLWEGANPWLAAWNAVSDAGELVPVLTPLGDLEDLRDIDAAQALAGDPTRLRTIEERYGAGSVLVSHAVPQGDADVGLGSVRIESRRYRLGEPGETIVDSYSQQQGEDERALLERAARTIARGIQEEWKRSNVMSFDQLQTLRVEVPVAELRDWLTVRRRLEGLASVAGSDLSSLTRQRAVVDLAFYGTLDQLLGQLEQRDLVLTRKGQGTFTGRPGGAMDTVVVSGGNAGSTLSGMGAGDRGRVLGERPEPDWLLTTRSRAAGMQSDGMDGNGQGAGETGMPGGVQAEPGAQQAPGTFAPDPNSPYAQPSVSQ